jgi:hypothetical protein
MNPPDRTRDRYSVTNGDYHNLTKMTLSSMKKSHTPEEKKNQQRVASAAKRRLNEIDERRNMPPPPLTDKNLEQMKAYDTIMNLTTEHRKRKADLMNLPAAAVERDLKLIASAKALSASSPEGRSRMNAKSLRASKKPRTNKGGKINVYTGPKNGKYIIKNGSKVYIDRNSLTNNFQYKKKAKPKKR